MPLAVNPFIYHRPRNVLLKKSKSLQKITSHLIHHRIVKENSKNKLKKGKTNLINGKIFNFSYSQKGFLWVNLSSLKSSVFWVVIYAKNSKKIAKNPHLMSQFIIENCGKNWKISRGF